MNALAARGTKRTCDNDECGRRFYDLNKVPTDCPYCGEAFVAPAAVVIDIHAPGRRRQAKNYRLEGPAVVAPQAEPAAADDVDVIADSDDDKTSNEELDLVLEVDDDADAAAEDVLGGDIEKDNAS
jgi:uncharacterized protein (TIGR02300 family)